MKRLFAILCVLLGVVLIEINSHAIVKNATNNPTPAPNSPAVFPVSWLPAQISISTPSGTLSTRTVSFRANERLENAHLNIVPALKRFLAVQPESLMWRQAE